MLFDGTPSDAPDFGKLPRLAKVLPHPFEIGTMRGLTEIITELAEEVEDGAPRNRADVPAIYLIIHDLTRFRDLRKADDDFGSSGSFGGGDKVIQPPSSSSRSCGKGRRSTCMSSAGATRCPT